MAEYMRCYREGAISPISNADRARNQSNPGKAFITWSIVHEVKIFSEEPPEKQCNIPVCTEFLFSTDASGFLNQVSATIADMGKTESLQDVIKKSKRRKRKNNGK